jgi:protein-L-isoaspartate(D-aspartate) O-methyltransferase
MILGQLYTNDIVDKRILEAMADIPREPFLPEGLRGAAYVDEDMDVGNGRYMMEPLTFAKLLDLAEITPACRILNIGCLNGYSAAILSRLGAHVVGVDVDTNAIVEARTHMQSFGITNVNLQPVSTMSDGYAMSAPYNVIVIQGAIGFISEVLGSQLAVGGRLVTIRNIAKRSDSPVGLGKGLLVTRIEHKLQYREHFDASCAVLPSFEQPADFVF